MRNDFIAFTRFLISAWIGAAVLFVITGVQEITNKNLTSDVRDILALIRFPSYYIFGFICVTASFMMSIRVSRHYEVSRIRLRCFQILLFIALLVMASHQTGSQFRKAGRPDDPLGMRVFALYDCGNPVFW